MCVLKLEMIEMSIGPQGNRPVNSSEASSSLPTFSSSSSILGVLGGTCLVRLAEAVGRHLEVPAISISVIDVLEQNI